MKDQGFKQSRAVRLGRGKIRGVGLFERIGLKITGRLDGMRGLPREEPSGTWTSPHLDREVRSYDEFASRMWGQLQIEEEDVYARLGTLIRSARLCLHPGPARGRQGGSAGGRLP